MRDLTHINYPETTSADVVNVTVITVLEQLDLDHSNLWHDVQTPDVHIFNSSRLMGKPSICICENKGADQLCGDREADQRLCFRYRDSTLPLLLKSEISSF